MRSVFDIDYIVITAFTGTAAVLLGWHTSDLAVSHSMSLET